MARAWHGWLRRGLLAGVLAVVAFAPVQTASAPAAGCGSSPCAATTAGTVRWTISLPGSWDASSALPGTVPLAPATAPTGPGTSSPPGPGTSPSAGATLGTSPATQQVYAAAGPSVVALGFGMIVYGYSKPTGHTLWVTGLTGFPAGSQIVSVRVWPAVVAVGVSDGPLLGSGGSSQRTVLLTTGSGRQLRSYPAAPFGGAVAASGGDTVVVGPSAVTSYSNQTGRVAWSRSTGDDDLQNWRSDGGHLYIADAEGGSLGSGPVTAVRRISLRTGAEQIIYPSGSPYRGRLAAVVRGVALFASTQGVSAYSGSTGQLLWHRANVVPESVDVVRGLFFLAIGSTSTLTGVQAWSGHSVARVPGASGSATGGVYGVRNGVALGLDLGTLGEAWGYSVAQQRVVWNTRTLPWPHFFVDLSGIGGSADPTDPTVLLSACPQRIATPAGDICHDPELVLIDR